MLIDAQRKHRRLQATVSAQGGTKSKPSRFGHDCIKVLSKLQHFIKTFLRFDVIFNNHFIENLLPSVSVNGF